MLSDTVQYESSNDDKIYIKKFIFNETVILSL